MDGKMENDQRSRVTFENKEEEEEDDETSEEEDDDEEYYDSEDEEDDESLYDGLDEVTKLKKQILRVREKHNKTLEDLETQRSQVHSTKTSISQLIRQITDYKNVLENEKVKLEADIKEKEEQIDKEKAITLALQHSTQEIEQEKETLVSEIDRLEVQHEEALEEETKIKNEMKKETVQNLQTLMDELQRIEEANELLRSQHEKSKIQIEDEKKQHEGSKFEFDREKERATQLKTNLESLKLTNEALLSQLKQFKKQSVMTSNNTFKTKSNAFPVTNVPTSSGSHQQLLQNNNHTGLTAPNENKRRSLSVETFQSINPSSDTTSSGPMIKITDLSTSNSTSSSISTATTTSSNNNVVSDHQYQFIRKLEVSESHIACMIIVDKQMWVGYGDGSIRRWEIETGHMLEDRRSHQGAITCLLLVKDRVWSCSKDKHIMTWSSSKTQYDKKALAGNKEKDAYGTVLLEVDQFVWCGCNDGIIRLWDPKGVKHKKDLKSDGGSGGVTCMLKRSNHVWSGTTQGLIHIWNTTTLKVIKSLSGHAGQVNAFSTIGASSYSSEIWSSSTDKTIRCWSAEEYQCIKVLQCQCSILTLLQVRGYAQVLGGGENAKIYVWNAKTYVPSELESHNEEGISALIADSKNQIWCGSWDKTICIWR